jgi:hypothetical protein
MNDMNQTDQSIPVAVQSKLRDGIRQKHGPFGLQLEGPPQIAKTLAFRDYVKRFGGTVAVGEDGDDLPDAPATRNPQ